MTDITIEALRLRERELELEAVAVRARVAEVRSMIELLEYVPPARRSRPRKIDIVPQRVGGGIAETECDDEGELPSIDDVRGILRTEPGDAA